MTDSLFPDMPPAPESLPPAASSHQVILASAGTGKTYQLTNRALALLARDVDPARILASTFTRKAAGEIFDRILGRLLKVRADEAERADLEAFLGTRLSRDRCTELLVRLARGIDRLSVQTLDAFYVRLGFLYPFELRLAPGWSIADEVEEAWLTERAVARTVDVAGADEMVNLLRTLKREAAGRAVQPALLALVEEGYDVFLDAGRDAWTPFALADPLARPELESRREALAGAAVHQTKKGGDDKRWITARDLSVALIDDGDWLGFLTKGLGKSLFDGSGTYYGHEFPEPLRGILTPLVEHARSEVGRLWLDASRSSRHLLSRFDTECRELKRASRRYGFADLPRALVASQAVVPLDHAALGFRLDAEIDHVLLDEFQDTSALQWRVLAPLVDTILACDDGSRSFFCVGDPKQSIFGFRQGEPRLLDGLARRDGVDCEQLDKSYRSSPVVLGAVNAVFEGIAGNATFADDEARRHGAEEWARRFKTHTANDLDLPGSAALHEVADEEDDTSAVLDAAADHVASQMAEAPDTRIAVLFRWNKSIPSFIYKLRERGIRASGEGGNPLTDSDAVLVALSLLQLADHPADAAAWFHVASSPFAALFGIPEDGGIDAEDRAGHAARVAAEVRERLVARGHGALLAELQQVVEAQTQMAARGEGALQVWDDWDRLRFAQLVDLAHAYEGRGTLRPSDFVRYCRRRRLESPMAARVRVMTVHASKGLEFDSVVLPDLDSGLSRRPPTLWTLKRDPMGRADVVFPYVKRDLHALDPVLVELDEAHRAHETDEALCVLYVAMTRAIRRLDMFVRAPHKRRPSVSLAAVLRAALPVGEPDDDGCLWRHPDSSDAPPADRSRAARPDEARPSVLAAPAVPRLVARSTPRRLVHVSPSGLAQEAGDRVRPAQLLAASTVGRMRGTLVHRWLEELIWLDDGLPGHEDWCARAYEHGDVDLDAQAVATAATDLRRWLEAPEIQALLTRPTDAHEREVWTERRFARPDGVGNLVSGSFDRVVLTRSGGRVLRADVYDYKTDAAAVAGELAALVEHYAPQMDAYRRAVEQLTGLDEGLIGRHLVFLVAGEVATL